METNGLTNELTNGVTNGVTNGLTNGVTDGLTNGVTNGLTNKETVVVIGLGMVGLSFIEKLLKYDTKKRYKVVSFCEESLGNY